MAVAGPDRFAANGVTVSLTCVTPVRLTEALQAGVPTLLVASAAPVLASVSATP